MKNNLRNYSVQTQAIANFHTKYDFDFLNLIESLLNEYPNIYEYLIIDKNVKRAIRDYLECHFPSKSVDFDSALILLDVEDSNVNQILNAICKVLGIAIIAKIIFDVTKKPSKASVMYGDLETLKKKNGEAHTKPISLESKGEGQRKKPFD